MKLVKLNVTAKLAVSVCACVCMCVIANEVVCVLCMCVIASEVVCVYVCMTTKMAVGAYFCMLYVCMSV